VALVNDLDKDWHGDVQLEVRRNRKTPFREARPVMVTALGRSEAAFGLRFPSTTGNCELVATINGPEARRVRSVRSVRVVGQGWNDE
jgi:hypothetical protein